jgi:hypothetical protein
MGARSGHDFAHRFFSEFIGSPALTKPYSTSSHFIKSFWATSSEVVFAWDTTFLRAPRLVECSLNSDTAVLVDPYRHFNQQFI